MSTKIYNGFKFTNSSLPFIHQKITEFRLLLQVEHKIKIARFMANIATRMIDDLSVNPLLAEPVENHPKYTKEDLTCSPLTFADLKLMERQKKIKVQQTRDPGVDFSFDVSLMPFENDVYAIVYTDQSDWLNLWSQQTFVESFSYWDNSDKPDDINEKEWEQRSKIWDSIFSNKDLGSTPAMNGFNAQCCAEYVYVEPKLILENIPTLDNRVQILAESITLSKYMKPEYVEEYKNKIFELVSNARKWMKTPEGAQVLKLAQEQVKNSIPHLITRDILNSPIIEIINDKIKPAVKTI